MEGRRNPRRAHVGRAVPNASAQPTKHPLHGVLAVDRDRLTYAQGMALACVRYDGGDTLMSEDGPAETPMALWPEVRAIDGAEVVLRILAARYRIAVATNATISDCTSIRRALARVALDPFVAEIFCFRELGLKKAD